MNLKQAAFAPPDFDQTAETFRAQQQHRHVACQQCERTDAHLTTVLRQLAPEAKAVDSTQLLSYVCTRLIETNKKQRDQ